MADDSASPVMLSHPLLVVMIPAYNEERFLAATIASLRAQTWRDFAVLISDNASTDRTEEVARAAIGDDARFVYHRQPTNVGSLGNGNFLLAATASPYMMWIGAHDILDPTYFEKVLPPLMADPRISLSFAETRWIDEEDRELRVTSGWMDTAPNLPILRYVLTPRLNDMCSEINNVIRRSAFEGAVFTSSWGTDNVALAQIAYRGRMHRVAEPLFHRREITAPRESYMKRLTGQEGAREDRSRYIEELVERLKIVAKGDPLLPLGVATLRAWLPYRFGMRTSGPLYATFRTAEWLKDTLKAATGWRRRRSWN